MTYLFNDAGTSMSTVLRGVRSELEDLGYDSLLFRHIQITRKKGLTVESVKVWPFETRTGTVPLGLILRNSGSKLAPLNISITHTRR